VSGGARVSLFAVLLAAVFAGAALAGAAVGPSGSDGEAGRAGAGHGAGDAGGHVGGEPTERDPSGDASAPPGLQVAQDGYRLVVERRRVDGGARDQPVRFRVLGPDGRPARDFEVEHEKRMHFIVVRRDLSGFQHLHPQMAPDGTWESRVEFGAGGTYRLFADFKVAGEKRTLGADVHAGGGFRPASLPRPAPSARTEDGLEVTLNAGHARAGREVSVELEVRRDGRAVDGDLQPYLGAKGHLVALREGDLAYLHTHPASDRLAFMATYSSAGAYRLFVQFLYGGRVQTAAFTLQVSR